MSPARRHALLQLAVQRGAAIVEDDYDGEFRFAGRPLDALKTLDPADLVFYVGTFSKTLDPALRLGHVVTPAWAHGALVAAKEQADWHCNLLSQETLAAFISQGHLARHVRRMQSLYAGRRTLLQRHLATELQPWLRTIPSLAGLHLSAFARQPTDIDALVEQARRCGVGVQALHTYAADGRGPQGLMFGYGAIDEAAITKAVERLRGVLERIDRPGRG
jgi:GntR family transcriptional regulator/MocR family aminotransferase